MCGIIGYCGKKNVRSSLLAGLKRLEYRGYDSAGISIGSREGAGVLQVFRSAGKIENLEKAIPGKVAGTWGIGHTRWATHGGVSEVNAHPHSDCKGNVSICHNGIIENYEILKTRLKKEGHKFRSETDSEVIAHLIESFYEGSLCEAVKKAISLLKGTYGILAIHVDEPDLIIATRNGSPLLVGVAEGEMLVASDASAMIAHTRQVVYCEDGEVVAITPSGFEVSNLREGSVDKKVESISWELQQLDRGEYPHFMLKEIHEQVDSIPRAFHGRLDLDLATAKLGGLNISERELIGVKRVVIIAAGTSYYAGLVAAYIMESMVRLPASTELASELRYRNPVVEEGILYFAISQSGETLDTLMAVKELQRKGARVLGICNVVGSSIARISDGGVYIHSGPEISVASTKAFTSQIAAFYLFALKMARMRHMGWEQGKVFIDCLNDLPGQVERILGNMDAIRDLARKYHKARNFMFLGRGINYPVALEGALKLKEIAYIHAEGYSAAEIKHGPIALINEEMPSLFLIPDDHLREKLVSNMKEVKARKGPVIAVCPEGDSEIAGIADDVYSIPATNNYFYPFLMVIPLQVFAYECALMLSRDVDQPRNLAKSVTVE